MDLPSSLTILAHCSCSLQCKPAKIPASPSATFTWKIISLTLRYGKCVADCSYLLNNCESLRAAAFTMAVAPTRAAWCSKACKLDAADDFACFRAFKAKCRPKSLHLLLGNKPAIDLSWMCLLTHLCTHWLFALLRRISCPGHPKLLEKDKIIAAWLEK
jgi:hypothetical protein